MSILISIGGIVNKYLLSRRITSFVYLGCIGFQIGNVFEYISIVVIDDDVINCC